MIHAPLSPTATKEEIVAYYRSFSKTLVDMYQQGEFPSLGESEPVVVAREFAEEHDIYEQVRVTRGEDGYTWHACPKKVGTVTPYTVAASKVQKAVDEYRLGRTDDFGQPYAAQFPAFVSEKDSFHKIEKAMFARLLEENSMIVLVNPGKGTMWRATAWPGRFRVLVTKNFDDREVNEFLRDHKELSHYRGEKDAVRYLGSNGDIGFPGVRWFSLVVEPTWGPGLMGPIAQRGYGDTFEYTYQRKERTYTVHPTRSPYITGSTMLFAKFHVPLLPIMAFSNFIRYDESQPVRTEVGFIEDYPPFESGVSKKDGIVYDVHGEGSWYNRRELAAIYAEQHGLALVSITGRGRFSVSLEGSVPLPMRVAISEKDGEKTYYFSDEFEGLRRVQDTDLPDRSSYVHIMGKGVQGKELSNGLRYRRARIEQDQYGVIRGESGTIYVAGSRRRLGAMYTMTPIPVYRPQITVFRHVSARTEEAIANEGHHRVVDQVMAEEMEQTGYHVLAYLKDATERSIRQWERYRGEGVGLWALDIRKIFIDPPLAPSQMSIDKFLKAFLSSSARRPSYVVSCATYQRLRRYLYGIRADFVGVKEGDVVRLCYFEPCHLRYLREGDVYVKESPVHFVSPTEI